MCRISTIAATVGLVGCDRRFAEYPDADLTDPEVVSRLEAHVRPDRLHKWLIQFPPEDFCATTTSGDRTIFEGPCEVDLDGDGYWDETWEGRAEREVDGDRTQISYESLWLSFPVACPVSEMFVLSLANGTSTEWSDGRYALEVDGAAWLLCVDPADDAWFNYTFDVSYKGEILDGGTGEEWAGEGRYADSAVGLVHAVTQDFRAASLDAPEAGRTALSTPDHEAILNFDGGATVSWELDGVEQPAFDATTACSTGPVDPNVFPVLVIGLLVRGRLATARARTPGS